MPKKKTTTEQLKIKIRQTVASSAAAILVLSFLLGFGGGLIGFATAPKLLDDTSFERFFPELRSSPEKETEQKVIVAAETAVQNVVNQASPSVVSVVATKDVPRFEQFFMSPFEEFFGAPQSEENETQRQEVAAGTGFVAAEKLVVTNKHVVADTEATYAVVTPDGTKNDAEVLARDPAEDLAILRVPDLNRAPLQLGDSDEIKPGQFVIAIGNALGEFQNTTSFGVVSALSRTLTATGGGNIGGEVLREVIQTDAAINFGNSGGPLLNLDGEVIGINVAKATGAENIGFSIPVNRIKDSLNEAVETGQVQYPFLGVRYVMITENIQKQNDLPFDYGALVLRGTSTGDVAVVPGSAADEVDIAENDIILAINGTRVEGNNTLGNLIAEYDVGDTITLKVHSKGETKELRATLTPRP